MLGVVGTVPDTDFSLIAGEIELDNDMIRIQGRKVPVNRGTPALLAAACKTSEALGTGSIFAILAGDIGLGDGSQQVYEYITQHAQEFHFQSMVFHYLQPDLDRHDRMLAAIDEGVKRPILIADAGSMYVAKMSGKAPSYDLFTPDVGELAFLADEAAPHPFYTRGFILHEENRIPDLIKRAYKHGNTARYMLVKGKQDFIAHHDGILSTIGSPVEEAMEAIGGTGDTLTGIVSSLIFSGMDIIKAATIAAKVNRLAGHLARPTPATQVFDIIRHIPDAIKQVLGGHKAALVP